MRSEKDVFFYHKYNFAKKNQNVWIYYSNSFLDYSKYPFIWKMFVGSDLLLEIFTVFSIKSMYFII